ncbi:MAG: putative two-component sensor histidine kinase [Anaerolineales bacterium]|nr:putative two-component sensor histidine kinase [Anaerolineales bacterium]
MAPPLILIADDNRDIREFLEQAVLTPAGYRVRSVGDGLSALTLARELLPDLVITDLQMPGLQGLDLVRRLRLDRPTLPVILMTSEGSEQVAIETLRAGAADYLAKPFEAEQLLAAVGRALAEGRRWRTLEEEQADARHSAATLERRLQEFEALSLIGRTVTAVLDLDTVLTTVVEAAVRLTGAEEGSLLLLDAKSGELYMRASKNFDEEFARTFRLHVQDSLAGQVIATGQPVVLDEQSPQKIKTSYLVHSLLYVPLRVRGKTIGVLGVDNRKAGRTLTTEDLAVMLAMADYAAIAIDNAQLYQASESERVKLETILTQTESGVIVLDPENRVMLINRAARLVYRVEGDVAGRSLAEVVEDPRLLALARVGGDAPRREELETPDGRVFSAQRTLIPGVGQAIVMHDITHLKDLDRIKSEFVTTVSHDLRSPLTAILGYVELIERAGSVNDQQREFIRRVRLSVEHMTRLVADLLDLGRIEAGLDTSMEVTPISVLARYALDGLRSAAEMKQQKVETFLSDDLPMVRGDPYRLRQMIANLLENAIKYTPANGEIVVAAVVEGDQVILRVSDSGPGIPAADQPYIFDKFFRASNVPDDTGGTGLGLSIVKSIVDSHQGRIWVDSQLGRGTTFTVVLPRADA